ncbi:MAG TPA: MCE family protein, partial [Burkholderiales bacterium]
MENRAYAIAAGVFTLLLAVAVFVTARWLTGGAVARDVYELVSPFPITGLNPRGTVRYRGVEVG